MTLMLSTLFVNCDRNDDFDSENGNLELPIIEEEGPKDWRDFANERIDEFRKSDLTIVVKNNTGELLANATVNVELKKHQFKFGAVVKANSFEVSPYANVYKETFLQYFNASGFANALKPKSRGGINEEMADPIMEWFNENKIYVRGHALQWEKLKTFRPEMQAVYNDSGITDIEKGEKLIELSEIHFRHAIEKWDVQCWDVVNETINNFIVNDLVPQNTLVHWFKLSQELKNEFNRPNLKLFMNDYQVISAIVPGREVRIEQYIARMDEMINEGAPIEGIGFQSRIKRGYLDPETMYERLCMFEKYNLPYHATEFEIRDEDNYTYSDALKKQILNELLTVYFSHPNTDGIWHWTFSDSESNNAPWALFKYDGTPYPCGEEWIKLMEEDFNTNEILTTNANGLVNLRGFKGDYEITISSGGKTITEYVTLNNDGAFEIILD